MSAENELHNSLFIEKNKEKDHATNDKWMMNNVINVWYFYRLLSLFNS